MKQKTIFISAIVALAAVFAGGVYFYNGYKADQVAAAAAKNRAALIRPHSMTLGRAEAPVQVVEFFDPACETCAAFYPLVKKMVADNRDDIRLVVRYAPLHPGSDEVVKVLEAARKQAKYWQAVEALLASQSEWVQHHQARSELIWPVLVRAGLDAERLKADAHSPEVAANVGQDIADAKVLGVTQTPEFFVNGRPLPSFGYQQLRDLVDEERAAARNAKGG